MEYITSCKAAIKRLLDNLSITMGGNQWILGRFACLGREIINRLDNPIKVINLQKARVDYFVESCINPRLLAKPPEVIKHLQRKDIFPFIIQESQLKWLPRKPPALIFIDSFSELTDQLFRHKKNKWQFCCNYSDLQIDKRFNDKFESKGLLQLDILEDSYIRFFKMIRNMYGSTPVIFVHFPITLEKRKKFIERYFAIKEIINSISKGFSPFETIVAEENIKPPEKISEGLENFPYHYNQETYSYFAERVGKLWVHNT